MENLPSKTFGFLKKLSLLLLLLPGAAQAENIKIVTANTILADMTKEITGDRAEVQSLIGPGEELHAFSPKPSDLKTISKSDLFIANGLNLEGWLTRLNTDKIHWVEASKGIKLIRKNGASDPHGWNSPYNAPVYIDNITYAVCGEMPANCNTFKDNAKSYKQRIALIAEKYQGKFKSLSPAARRAITAHDAFGYLARDFDLEFHPIKGMNDEEEISAKILAGMIDQIRRSAIRVVFVENIANTAYARKLVSETDAFIGGELYAESVSSEDFANSYEKVLEYNLKTIYEAMEKAQGSSDSAGTEKEGQE